MIFGLALEKIIWPLVGALAACAVVIGLWEATPVIGPRARVERQVEQVRKWRGAYEEWHAYGVSERKAFQESERLRGLERHAGAQALEDAGRQCRIRITEARRSAAAIRDIITKEPDLDAKGCPSRSVVGADRLRDALQPSAGR